MPAAAPPTAPPTAAPAAPPAVAAVPCFDAEDDAAARELLQLVSFEIGDEEYAIPIVAVQEINRVMPITPVPHSPAAVQGVINLRGRIIPVVDLRRRFGLPPRDTTAHSRIVVVEVGPQCRVLGFTVDRVHEVLRLDADVVDPAPAIACGPASPPPPHHTGSRGAPPADFITGVGKLEDRLLILIDLQRLFTDDDLVHAAAAA